MSKNSISKIFFKNRKSQTEIIFIIIAVVFITISLYWYNNFRIGAKESQEVESCRLSVLQNSDFRMGKLLNKEVLGVEIPTPEVASIDCPKRQLTISKNVMNKGYNSTDFGAKYEIANAMRLCWYQWGQGQMQPFDVGWFSTGKRFCSICYEVEFTDDFKQSYSKQYGGKTSLDNFYNFLNVNKVPDGSKYFINYLTNQNLTWPVDINMQNVIQKIDLNKKYSVVYTINKPGLLTSSVLGVGGALGGCAAGSFIPIIGNIVGCGLGFVAFGTGGFVLGLSGEDESAVWLVPSDTLNSENLACDMIYQ